ncbi:hypothetical protein BT96DRAFT_972214 [Gymnopus androsaceus JB14]|uniref:Uncharacterized protein n=1 Tax=Gymnopus androsaceus JB14 TaxID=1447944 RepID=A0A6A4I2H4_9AGAR|nr:hypothetical protein BT96DRAFT_972214 [Gymnopus androsaceus JB14]
MPQYLPSYNATPEEQLQSMTRPRRNAVDISALSTTTNTRVSRRNAVDYTSSLVKSDWWHANEEHAFVPRNFRLGNAPCVPFTPSERKQGGVAMTELESYQDLAFPSELVTSFLPKGWFPRQPFVQLSVNFPGYNHLKIRRNLFFFSPNGNPRTIQEIGHDIATIYRTFIQDNYAAFNPAEHHALRLGPGPNQVTFGHLRLVDIQLCDVSEGCEQWVADVTYVQC